MRIGIFTDTYPPFINGVSTSVLMLKKGLEELGCEVFVDEHSHLMGALGIAILAKNSKNNP